MIALARDYDPAEDPAVLRRVISLLLLADRRPPTPDPTPLRRGLDPSRRDRRPWCWDRLAAALAAGPAKLGALAAAVYGAPATAADRSAMGVLLLRCRETGLVARVGYGWYALPGADAEGTRADFERLLRAPGGVTVRRASFELNVPVCRVHHWLHALRADPALGPRLRKAAAGVPGWANGTRRFWLEGVGPAPVGRPRALDGPTHRATMAVLADGPRSLGDLARAVYGALTPATRVRMAVALQLYRERGAVVRVGRGVYARSEEVSS